MMRKLGLLLTVLLLLSSILASMAYGDAGETTITFWGWQGELENAWLTHLIPDFEAANPGIKVDLVMMPWQQYWQKVQTSMASDTLPDLMTMSVAYLDLYAKNGALMDISNYVKSDIDQSKYYESGLETVRYPDTKTGPEYAFPWNVVGNCLYYNKTLFDAAGVAHPTDDWTWEDVRNAAIKLTQITESPDTTTYGFAVDNGYTVMDSIIYSYGGAIVSPDLKTCVINSPETKKAVQFIYDLIHTDKVSPAINLSTDTMAFASGRVAMEIGGAWSLESFGDTTNFDWDIAKMPIGPSGNRCMRAWSDSIAITKSCKNPDKAWDFIKFLVGEKGQTKENLSGTRIPILLSASTSDNWLNPGSKPEHKIKLLEALPESSPFVFRGGWGEWNTVYESEMFSALSGEKPIDQALADAQVGIQEVLDSNQ